MRSCRFFYIALLCIPYILQPSNAQAPYRVAGSYEDTVRVAILWNMSGNNFSDGVNVGPQTRDFTVAALDTLRVPNTFVLPTVSTSWNQIRSLWPGKLPHVIVHVNSGFYTNSGGYLETILDSAVANKIGVVSIGDDAASFAQNTFGFEGVDNVPAPMGGAQSIDSLWIGLNRAQDDLIKTANDYPFVNGVISNAVDSIMSGSTAMNFKPYCTNSSATCRHESDADKYNIRYPAKTTFLGYQRGFDNGAFVGNINELNVVVAIQDTIGYTIRRGVALSYEPQFLQNRTASEQIVYDAIMYASLAHTLSVPNRLVLVVPGDSMAAGDTVRLRAIIVDQKGDTITDASVLNDVRWEMVPSTLKPGDRILDPAGPSSRFTATVAYRTAKVYATYYNPSNGIRLSDTADIRIRAGIPVKLVIEASPNAPLNNSTPVGGNGSVTLSSTMTGDSVYAILRDRFDNYVANDGAAKWDTLPPGNIVNAVAGRPALGEGIISKLSQSGSTRVKAYNFTYSLGDTIDVTVSNILYDSLRIYVLDNGSKRYIDTLYVRVTADTSLFIEGRRVDTKAWIPVQASWNLSGTLKINPPVPVGTVGELTVAPTDTGRGLITATSTVTLDSKIISDAVIAIFKPGDPKYIEVFPKSGAPDPITNKAYSPVPDTAAVIIAGQPFNMNAKLFDLNHVWLKEYETYTSGFTWTSSTTDEVTLTSAGNAAILTTTKAYRFIEITVSYNEQIRTTIRVWVKPNVPHHLVIEGSADISKMNDDDSLKYLTIMRNETRKSVYAIIRDQYGNFVEYSDTTNWSSSNSNLQTQNGLQSVGEGVAVRAADSGSAIMTARSLKYPNMSNSITVQLLNIYYLRLMITDAKGIRLPSLTMNTNQDTTIHVWGMRSDDTTKWEPVQARWELSQNMTGRLDPSPPQQSEKYSFSPKDTVLSGWIRVTQGNDSITIPDTLPVIFTPGPPLSTSIEILTPPQSRIAGDTIKAVVRITNEDGLVPGEWCFDKAYYQDTLGQGGRPDPVIIIDGKVDTINTFPSSTHTGRECFNGGYDTISFILYNAPVGTDSLHKIFVNLNGLTASAPPFKLYPAELYSLTLERFNGEVIGDTIKLNWPDSNIVILSIGSDRYGNRIGPTLSNWTKNGSIPPISKPDNQNRIFYESLTATDNGTGTITASASGNPIIKDSVFVIITGIKTQLLQAITRDLDGNGYLDHIELHFSRPVSLPAGYTIPDLQVKYGLSTTFTVDSIEGLRPGGATDTVFVLSLHENQDQKLPQTSWRPYIRYSSFLDVAEENRFITEDGAGPVVWSVEKDIIDIADRRRDKVTIRFSEPVLRMNGGKLNTADTPSVIFYVWERDPMDSTKFIKVDSIFAGIQYFQQVPNDSTVIFAMTNDEDLTSRHFVSIGTQVMHITDKSPGANLPNLNNQLVRVKVNAPPPEELIPFPNPSSPTFAHVPAGKLNPVYEKMARSWVLNDRAGVVFTFAMPVPTEGKVKFMIKIYDIAGNHVITASNNDLAASLPEDVRKGASSTWDVDIYWNCSNESRMRVAPGVYKVVAYLDFTSTKYQDARLVANVGVAR